tara:strand:- start:168117 stop:169286 length:1170 start_codon:yes stop_codon:yes gene_type:complete
MTNSPPSKVKLAQNEPARVLACGIDSLVLALNVSWVNDTTFKQLAELKAKAKLEKEDEPAELIVDDETSPWHFVVKPHGTGGYEWLLTSHEMGMRIGNWLEPHQRPSVMVDIRSETLWTHGPQATVERVVLLIESLGGEVQSIKPSRVDICVDTLIPLEVWNSNLIQSLVTRARNINTHFQSRELSGFSIGKGKICARLYDKPMEINAKSNKVWMYDIWGIESIDDQHRIIRTEFQIRREALVELGLINWFALTHLICPLWSYCTQSWLKIVDDASLHHTQQHLLPWWRVIEKGFMEMQDSEPLVRNRSVIVDKQRLAAQALGGLASFLSVDLNTDELQHGDTLDRRSHLMLAVEEALDSSYLDDDEFTKRVLRKQAKHNRSGNDFKPE